jgi:hypothetical protein
MTQLNRGQIIDQALQRVGNNSVSLKMQARTTLNRLLTDLYQGYDWPFLWTSALISIPPNGVVILPTDFLKPEDDQALVMLYAYGQPLYRPIQEVDRKQFRNFVSVESSQYPRAWRVDYGTKTGQVMPRPLETITATLSYKALPIPMPFTAGDAASIALYDEDHPVFPWDSFLIDFLTDWAMSYEVDPRRAEQLTINEEMLGRLRGATWPERSYPSTVQLDPLFFSTPSWGRGG